MPKQIGKRDLAPPEGSVLVFNMLIDHVPSSDMSTRYVTLNVRVGAQVRAQPGTSASLTSHPLEHLKMHATGNNADKGNRRALFGWESHAAEYEMFSDLHLGDAERYTSVLRMAEKLHSEHERKHGPCPGFAGHVLRMGRLLGINYGYMEVSRNVWRRVTLEQFAGRIDALERAFAADEFDAALRAIAA